ncbi:SDR family NAD(P)-dependent oxidoreductase [Halomicrobium urmianum]|uniref:SDR family NAD(P)-dependent oxidoreductase n=1 Tax=Halomicrobium urmianum TaxID=1586233 RepID=UPI001CDA3C48|nr:SDR family oxidoreductase [Halomicrobium urmianum]
MTVLDRFRLDGDVAVVTGGNRGIGRAIAQALAEAGADVAIGNRDAESGRRAADEIAADTGADVRAYEVDVTDEAQVEALVEATVADLGGLDVLVNNAGITIHAPAEEMTVEQFQRVLDVNVTGAFRCAKHAGRVMIENPGDGRGGAGSVVTLSSMSARVANYPQHQVAYNASKGAVDAFTRQLASEWAEHDVRVNAVAPGYVRTDPVDEALAEDPELEALWTDEMLLSEMARPEDVAPLVVYLASEASWYVTGASLLIDGGYTVR